MIDSGVLPIEREVSFEMRINNWMFSVQILLYVVLLCLLPAYELSGKERVLKVTATAYNSVPRQTQGNPKKTAWGKKLAPEMKAIAVSNDLIEMGLRHGVKVRIEGLSGTYMVMDKLPKRWHRRIDIYMGKNIKSAKKWGKRKVTIRW
jgi:3D (Asp-Asp-Asp) domain-containing protein